MQYFYCNAPKIVLYRFYSTRPDAHWAPLTAAGLETSASRFTRGRRLALSRKPPSELRITVMAEPQTAAVTPKAKPKAGCRQRIRLRDAEIRNAEVRNAEIRDAEDGSPRRLPRDRREGRRAGQGGLREDEERRRRRDGNARRDLCDGLQGLLRLRPQADRNRPRQQQRRFRPVRRIADGEVLLPKWSSSTPPMCARSSKP